MQVSVETLNDLERRVTVRVPAEEVAKEIQNRLQSLSRRIKVDGFRPGKVPLKLIKRMYGDQVRVETVTELVNHSLSEALAQENLSPLSGPKIEPKTLEEGHALEYSATFEVLPEFEPAGFEHIQVERPVAEVTERDVDHMIETLRRQRAIWNAVERPARAGDRLTLDVDGKIDGQVFPGGKRQNAGVVLGQGMMLEAFENRLAGLAAGAETEFDLTFPEDYRPIDLAGKTAHFQVKLHAVQEASLPEVDEAFAENFDVRDGGGIPAFRQAVRENMEHQLREHIQRVIKHQVMRGLLEANAIPLPRALVEAEIERLASQVHFEVSEDNEGAKKQIQQLKAQFFETEARQRVALGLLISKLAAKQGIQVDEEQVRARLDAFAATQEDPAEVLRYYEQTPKALDDVRALAFEDQVVGWVLERARVTERASTFADIMKYAKPAVKPAAQESSE